MKTPLDPEKGDTIIDHREDGEAVRTKIKAAAGGRPIHYAYDAVSEKGSCQNVGAADRTWGDHYRATSGDYQPSEGILIGQTIVGSVHMPPATGKTIEDGEFGAAFFPLIGRGLAQGGSRDTRTKCAPVGWLELKGHCRI